MGMGEGVCMSAVVDLIIIIIITLDSKCIIIIGTRTIGIRRIGRRMWRFGREVTDSVALVAYVREFNRVGNKTKRRGV